MLVGETQLLNDISKFIIMARSASLHTAIVNWSTIEIRCSYLCRKLWFNSWLFQGKLKGNSTSESHDRQSIATAYTQHMYVAVYMHIHVASTCIVTHMTSVLAIYDVRIIHTHFGKHTHQVRKHECVITHTHTHTHTQLLNYFYSSLYYTQHTHWHKGKECAKSHQQASWWVNTTHNHSWAWIGQPATNPRLILSHGRHKTTKALTTCTWWWHMWYIVFRVPWRAWAHKRSKLLSCYHGLLAR